jgi:hypothetical protein
MTTTTSTKSEVMVNTGDGEAILGISPVAESYNGQNSSFTVCVTRETIWIRAKMFEEQLYYDNKQNFPTNSYIPILISLRGGKVRLLINNMEIKISYTYPFTIFRVGIINFKQYRQKDICIKNIRVLKA